MLMPYASLSTKGQVVIPKDVRDALGLRPGDRVEFRLHEGHADLRKGSNDALERFLAGPRIKTWKPGELERMIKERHGERLLR